MSPSNPYWYEELRDNPLSRKTFTDQLAVRIKDKAFASTTAQNQSRTVLRPLVIAGVGLLCLLGLILFLSDREWSGKGGSSESYMAGIPEPPAGLPETPIQAAPVLSDEEMNRILSKKSPADSEWDQLINNVLPHEDEEVMDNSKEMLYKESVGNDIMLIFSKTRTQFQQAAVAVDYYEWVSQKWERQTRAAYTLPENSNDADANSFATGSFKLDEIPLLCGAIIDPKISQIRITNKEQDIQKMAEIISADDGHSYWFATLPQQKDAYHVEAMDVDGEIVATGTYYVF